MRCYSMAGFWFTMTLWFAAQGCSGSPAVPAAERPPDVTATAEEVGQAQAADSGFAIALYRQLASERPGKNLFLSPFSVSSALLIAAEGASGETAAQMGNVLHFPAALRNSAAKADGLPWRLAPLHKGQAAIAFRLSPKPVSPELSAKIVQLRDALAAANKQTAEAESAEKWPAARKSHDAAEKIADELNALLKETEPYVWRTANALWGEKTYPFRPSYLDAIREFYGSAVFPVDFRENLDGARQQINGWVARQTMDRIKDLFPAGSLTSNTRLVIADAVYFKGEWLEPFDASATQSADFHEAGGKTASVPMMTKYLGGTAGYGAFKGDGTDFHTPREIPVNMRDDDPSLYPGSDGFTAARLPYKGGKLFMVIFVPQSPGGLDALERKLPSAGLKPWLAGVADRAVIVHVPKFKLEAEYGLEKSLAALGMVRPFNLPGAPDGAQFDRMTATDDPAQQLYISAVRHKTFVEVNEKGTEAAAATGIAMAMAEARAPRATRPFIPTFRADKPFLFAICDAETQSILFMGRVVSPPK